VDGALTMNRLLRGSYRRALGLLTIASCCVALGCSQDPDTSSAGGNPGKSPRADAASPPRTMTAGSSDEQPGPGEEYGQGDGETSRTGADDVAKDEASAEKSAAKKREPLFEGWPAPRVALFITGRLSGYVEPCGCTGLVNQKGGLVRRRSLHQQLSERGWPLVAIDAGNQVRRYGPQAEVKFQISIEGLQKMDYRAIALGPDDLQLSAGVLLAVAVGDGDKPSPVVSANVAVLEPDLTPRYIVADRGGAKVGVTGVLGKSRRQQVTNDDIIIGDPAEGLAEVWPQLEQEDCDVYVLIADAEIDESKELGQKFPGFDVVVTTGGAAEPTYQPDRIAGGNGMLVQVGTKGMYVVVVGVFDDAENPLRYQRVPLDDRFPDSREMLDLLASYQSELERLGLDGLELKPIPHPSGYSFVGSEACGECHTKAYAISKESKHSHATDTLVKPGERSEVPRHHDPECISCHVVGWNPQKYFPYKSGYLGLEETPAMRGVGCENCHGPGSEHVKAENGDIEATDEELTKLREFMRLPLKEAEKTCLNCHDLDNSINFHKVGAFLKYWNDILHEGMD